MKRFTPEHAIVFAETKPHQFDDFCWVLGQCLGDTKWIQDGIASGRYEAKTVLLDDVPSYLAVYEITPQKVIHVVAAASLPNGKQNILAIPHGLAEIGRAAGCTAIQCMTMRPGLAQVLLADGFLVDGVSLSCRL